MLAVHIKTPSHDIERRLTNDHSSEVLDHADAVGVVELYQSAESVESHYGILRIARRR